MANLTDLVGKKMSEMSSDELQEMLRNIRRQRREPAPVKQTKAPREKLSTKGMSAEKAKELLDLLGEL